MAEKQNTPEIRFEGFTDPWEQRKLGNCGTTYGGLTGKTKEDFGHGNARFIPYTNVFDNPLTDTKRLEAVEIDSSQNQVAYGDAFFTVSSETPDEVGMSSVWLADQEDVYLNSFCFGYRQDSTFDPHYLAYMLRSRSVRPNLTLLAQGISRFNISKNKVMELSVPVPSAVEQEQLGQYFTKLDSLITLHQRKYDKLCTVKKSMLDKMFPKPGETEPEIRFEGFTDPWEQRKLGSIAASFDYGLNAAATEYDGQNKYLRITDIDDATHEFLKSDLTTPLADLAMSADYLLEEGDLLFARTGASVGKTYLYRQYDGTVYFAGFLIRARIGESADPEFVYQATLTDAYKKYVAITSQRSGQPGVNAQEYADYQLMLPSRTEQQQIGMTLRSLDNLITLHQRKLELLRNIKKSLLDRMFV